MLQLKAPRSDISVDVVDSKLDWLRELALSMNTSSIRGDTTPLLLLLLIISGTPELIERLSRIVQQMKGLGEAPDSFVAVQNIRDSDTTVSTDECTLTLSVIFAGAKVVIVEAWFGYTMYGGSYKMIVH